MTKRKIWFYLFWILLILNVGVGFFVAITSGAESISNILTGRTAQDIAFEKDQRDDDRFNNEIILGDLNKFDRLWTHKCFRVNNTIRDFLGMAEKARRDKDYTLAYDYLDKVGSHHFYWNMSCMEDTKDNIFPPTFD
ncbi:MAG: hypothetical protein ABIB47_01280 [Candidatus Woesearchaeota archaeon]